MKQCPLRVRIDRRAFECEHDEDAWIPACNAAEFARWRLKRASSPSSTAIRSAS